MTVAKKYADQTFTLSEYLALPENDRMEILEGMPYLLASPSDQHQRIVLAFGAAFLSALRGKPCQPRIAPLDVFLDEADERKPTVVQPDVFVVCDRKKLDDRGCHGAPDLIIEVLSPGTRQHDLVRKMNLYRRYGVREYWTVEAELGTVLQYVLDDKGYRLAGAYEKGDKVPVQVLESCTIDLNEIFSE